MMPASRGKWRAKVGAGAVSDVGPAQLRSSGHHRLSLSAFELENLEAETHGPFPTL